MFLECFLEDAELLEFKSLVAKQSFVCVESMWNLKSMDSTLYFLMTCFYVFSVIKTSPHFMHSTFCLLSKFPFFLFNILYRIWIILKQTLSIVIKSSVNNYKTHNCWRISICYIYGTQKAGPSTWKNSVYFFRKFWF